MSNPVSSLPDAWVQRIWQTMRATYGGAFDRQWECPQGADPAQHVQGLMAHWGKELARFQQSPQAIAYALDNLPEDFPPNLLQFRALCNRRPDVQQPALPMPKADPQRVAREIAKIRENFKAGDCLGPLRELHDRDVHHGGRMANGKPITLAQRATYRRALGIDRMEQTP